MDKKWYTSSTGTGDVSLTIKGAMVAIVPLIVMIANTQGFAVDESIIISFIDSIFTVVASVMVVVGVCRKIYLSFKK